MGGGSGQVDAGPRTRAEGRGFQPEHHQNLSNIRVSRLTRIISPRVRPLK